jgi:hypothetical protein
MLNMFVLEGMQFVVVTLGNCGYEMLNITPSVLVHKAYTYT